MHQITKMHRYCLEIKIERYIKQSFFSSFPNRAELRSSFVVSFFAKTKKKKIEKIAKNQKTKQTDLSKHRMMSVSTIPISNKSPMTNRLKSPCFLVHTPSHFGEDDIVQPLVDGSITQQLKTHGNV